MAAEEAPAHVRPATRGDLPDVVDLLVACDVAALGEPDTTIADVASDWSLDGFDLARDAWVAEGAGGLVVGYAYAGDQYRTGELEGDFWTHPGHHDPGLAGRLLGLIERRALELAAERGYPDPSLDVFCLGSDTGKRGLLRGRGFAHARTIYRMAADLGQGVPSRPVPKGIAIRPFRVPEDAAIMHATMTDAFRDHFRQSREPFEAWQERLMGHADFDAGLWYLAWDGAEAAGALIAYDHGDLGWVRGVGVRRPWRRRGLGAALLTHAFVALAARGQSRVELGVDAEGATQPLRLYESVGMHVAFTYELHVKRLSG